MDDSRTGVSVRSSTSQENSTLRSAVRSRASSPLYFLVLHVLADARHFGFHAPSMHSKKHTTRCDECFAWKPHFEAQSSSCQGRRTSAPAIIHPQSNLDGSVHRLVHGPLVRQPHLIRHMHPSSSQSLMHFMSSVTSAPIHSALPSALDMTVTLTTHWVAEPA